jgi:hypothetical protein
MRRVLGLLGLLTVAGLAIPPLAAYREKIRRAADGETSFDETADELDFALIFDGLEARSRAGAFRGGDILAWYGGGTLDLRGATLDPAGARLRLRAIFGGLDIVVPTTWRVEVHSRAILGGVGDMTDQSTAAPDAPTLVVDALAVMGGASIRSRDLAEEDASDAADASEVVADVPETVEEAVAPVARRPAPARPGAAERPVTTGTPVRGAEAPSGPFGALTWYLPPGHDASTDGALRASRSGIETRGSHPNYGLPWEDFRWKEVQ